MTAGHTSSVRRVAERRYLVAGFAEALAVLSDQRLSNDPANGADLHPDITSQPVVSQRRGTSMQLCDAPQHNRLRRAVAAALSQRSYAAQLDQMKRRADELFDALVARGGGDLVTDFVLPVVFEVICDLLGVPEVDRAQVHTLVGRLHAARPRSQYGRWRRTRRLRCFAARGEGKAAGRRFVQRARRGPGRGSAHGCRGDRYRFPDGRRGLRDDGQLSQHQRPDLPDGSAAGPAAVAAVRADANGARRAPPLRHTHPRVLDPIRHCGCSGRGRSHSGRQRRSRGFRVRQP